MDWYSQLKVANKLGFKTPGLAIIKLGKIPFLEHCKNEKLRNKNFDNQPTKREVKKEKIHPEGGKVIPFNENYVIYPDGRCYSLLYHKFLRPKIQRKNNKRYYSYELNRGTGYRIARLVYFFFGNHNFKTIKEVPEIIYINGNNQDFNIENLDIKPKKLPPKNQSKI